MPTLTLVNTVAKLRVDAVRAKLGIEATHNEPMHQAYSRDKCHLEHAARRLRAVLRDRFPVAFAEGVGRPLKIGIHDDILAAVADLNYTEGDIGYFLRQWVRRSVYREATVAGALRIGLDGQPVSEIPADQAAFARSALRKAANWRKAQATTSLPKAA